MYIYMYAYTKMWNCFIILFPRLSENPSFALYVSEIDLFFLKKDSFLEKRTSNQN